MSFKSEAEIKFDTLTSSIPSLKDLTLAEWVDLPEPLMIEELKLPGVPAKTKSGLVRLWKDGNASKPAEEKRSVEDKYARAITQLFFAITDDERERARQEIVGLEPEAAKNNRSDLLQYGAAITRAIPRDQTKIMRSAPGYTFSRNEKKFLKAKSGENRIKILVAREKASHKRHKTRLLGYLGKDGRLNDDDRKEIFSLLTASFDKLVDELASVFEPPSPLLYQLDPAMPTLFIICNQSKCWDHFDKSEQRACNSAHRITFDEPSSMRQWFDRSWARDHVFEVVAIADKCALAYLKDKTKINWSAVVKLICSYSDNLVPCFQGCHPLRDHPDLPIKRLLL